MFEPNVNEYYVKQMDTAVNLVPGAGIGYRQDCVYHVINDCFEMRDNPKAKQRLKAMTGKTARLEYDLTDSLGDTTGRVSITEHSPGDGKFIDIRASFFGAQSPIEFSLDENLKASSFFLGETGESDEVFATHVDAYSVMKTLALSL